MDRSDDGGMAPPLQACNHQSTSQVTSEDKTKGATSHEKVNGGTRKESMCKGTLSPTSTANAAGDAKSSSSLESCDPSCILPGLKGALPAASMPAIHIGQGDSTVTNVTSLNGWSHCNKLNSTGVLQESSKIPTLETDESLVEDAVVVKKPDANKILSLAQNVRELGVPHNGGLSHLAPHRLKTCPDESTMVQIKETVNTNLQYVKDDQLTETLNSKWGQSPVPVHEDVNHDGVLSLTTGGTEQSLPSESDERVDAPASESTDKTESEILQSSKYTLLQTFQQSESSESLLPKICDPAESSQNNQKALLSKSDLPTQGTILRSVPEAEQGIPASFPEPSRCTALREGSKSPASLHAKCFETANDEVGGPVGDHHAPKCTDSLTGDLSKMNMSDVSASILQKVDAGALPSGEKTPYTVNPAGQDTDAGRFVKSLDFSVVEPCAIAAHDENNQTGQEVRIDAKSSSAIAGATALDYRFDLLKKKIDALRCRTLKRHIEREMTSVASQLPATESSQTDWPCGNVIGSECSVEMSCSSEFWRLAFEPTVALSGKPKSESALDVKTQKLTDKVSTAEKSKLSSIVSLKREPAASRPKLSGSISVTDAFPRIQPVPGENSSSRSALVQKIYRQAQLNTGLLKKELQYALSCCDPEITDSSSDEEMMETVPVTTTQRTKSALKAAHKLSVTRFQKSFCKWVAERAEMARKWAWLQSQISSLEYSIRQQGELYGQLRDRKGVVQLDAKDLHASCSSHFTNGQSTTSHQIPESAEGSEPVSVSPCSSNSLINNIHHQTFRLFDKLSPISGGSPSPDLPPDKTSQSMGAEFNTFLDNNADSADSLSVDASDTCARTRQLHLATFRNRALVKISSSSLASIKPLKLAAVPNDSLIMAHAKKNSESLNEEEDYTSLAVKAALHDHSYHMAVSSVTDIPLSFSMRAVMKSKRKWCKKSSSRKRNDKVSKKQKRKKKTKHKTQRKNKRSYSAVVSGHMEGGNEGKVRKLASQVADPGRRPHKGSLDSDLDSSLVTSGTNSHRASGSGTPTSELTTQTQTYSKKKKVVEQPYDINNIVIPHGLASARIEKLAYKEIQTPSWKILESSGVKQEIDGQGHSEGQDLSGAEMEDTSNQTFQRRHDRHEVIEKRKYMAFMEWSMSRKGSRGSRMGNIRGPRTSEPASPSLLRDPPSPVPFMGDAFSIASYSGILSRQMSCDLNLGRPGTPLQQGQRLFDTPLNHSLSSPSGASWSDGLGPGRDQSVCAAPVHRASSDSINGHTRDQLENETWDIRSFPLVGEDLRLMSDVEYAKTKLCGEEGTRRHSGPRQTLTDGAQIDHARNFIQESGQPSKFGAIKRRRTDSRTFSLISHGDAARYSDASNASVSSTRRKFKKSRQLPSHASQGRRGKGGKEPFRIDTAKKSRGEFLHVRLSETDESPTDSADSDFDSSSDEISSPRDDAGRIIDDYADPEWEAPAQRHRDRR